MHRPDILGRNPQEIGSLLALREHLSDQGLRGHPGCYGAGSFHKTSSIQIFHPVSFTNHKGGLTRISLTASYHSNV
jgi:hypothetical protein